jgi:hypothetical protein
MTTNHDTNNEVARLREEVNFIPTEQAFRDVCARADNAQTELLKTQKELTAYKRMVDALRLRNGHLREIAARALAITKTWNVDYEEVEKIEEALDVIRGIKP